MCGIFGYFSQNPTINPEDYTLDVLKSLHHRGPDDQGVKKFSWSDKKLVLGHTRLSIIDLSFGGHQPMQTSDGRYTIVFNGEIYNYRELRQELKSLGYVFTTDSDTEVLLFSWIHWRDACFRKLIGMFAFVVFDNNLKILTLVRDAFGIKPLFYCRDNGSIMFTSEIPAMLVMLRNSPKLNFQRVYDYLIYGVQDSGLETFLQGIYHVPPAHWLQVNLNEADIPKPQRWWEPSILEESHLNFKQASEKLRSLFLDSINLHLRSDVSLGVALSGGIDSSAIACSVRYLEPHIDLHTFSYIATGKSFSEEYWIDIVNEHIKSIAHKVRVGKTDFEADVNDLIIAQGEPFCTTSMYAQYRVFKEASASGVKVVLEGQGGDELLAGYHGYQGQRMRSLWERRNWLTMAQFARKWRQWPGREHLNPWKALGGQLLPYFFRQFLERILDLKPTPKWININQLDILGVGVSSPRFGPISGGKGRRVMEVLLQSMREGSLPSLLRYGDRNAMHFSIENRVPFLTLPLAEFVFSLPEHYLIAENGETKSLFRAAMRGIVPNELLTRRDKIGFETPMGELASGLLLKFTKSKLLTECGLFDNELMQAALEQCQKNTKHFSAQIWRLLNLNLWIQKHLAEDLFCEREYF